uniref:Genome polyprotein n=1 Tax=Zeugodacus cucurbitae TaxID=28588 RepID=A0A0A1WNZ6_ZEUCU
MAAINNNSLNGRDWESLNDWVSDVEGDVSTVTVEEAKCDKLVGALRRKNVHRELVFSPSEPSKILVRFDKRQYALDLKQAVKSNTAILAVKKLLAEYESVGKLTAASHVYLKHALRHRKTALQRVIFRDNYPRIVRGMYKKNYIYSFIKSCVSSKAKLSFRKRAERTYLNQMYVQALANNRFAELSVDDADEIQNLASEIIIDEDPISHEVKRCLIKTSRGLEDLTKLVDHNLMEIKEEAPPRNIFLLNKLHNIINYLAEQRKKLAYRMDLSPIDGIEPGQEPEQFEMVDIPLDPNRNPYQSTIQPEMMSEEEPEQQQEAGPVVLNALQQDQVEVTMPVDNDMFWIKNSTSDVVVDEKHASSMEILATRFVWKSSDPVGSKLFSIDLPVETISNNMTHPAAMMFGQYAYWNGDIKIRIHINTTPFHVGKLIFSWYYSQKFDKNQDQRDNIASSVQLPNVCYNASVGDDVVLEVPFRNYRSMLCTRQRAGNSLSLYLGTLRCHVFNPLTLNVATNVDGYVHVSFINSKFTGICPRKNIQPEMDVKSLVKVAEKTLKVVDAVVNMDNPPVVAPPQMFTPQFTDSFATGRNDVTNVHSLRLDPTGQTQHPAGSSSSKHETSIKNIINRWGLLRTVNWKASDTQGATLLTLPATPELEYSEYFPVTYRSGVATVNAAVLPPVSAISIINAFNRGSLEYKFEIIASRYHTGALLASFTPVLKNVVLKEALQSYNTTLDVGNVTEYIFKVPYINERPYNPRFNREISDIVSPQLTPIGEVNLFVLNQLRNVAGTSNDVYINVYLRASLDFELAVPVSPLYSINIDNRKSDQPVYIYPVGMSNTIGVATWRYMDSIANKALVGKANNSDDGILQMVNMKPFTVYEKDLVPSATSSPVKVRYQDKDGKLVGNTLDLNFEYMAMFIVNDDHNKYTYAMYFIDKNHAESYCRAHYRLATSSNQYPNSPTIKQWMASDSNLTTFYLGDTDVYSRYDYAAKQWRYREVYSAVVQAEMDAVMCDPSISELSSLTNGLRLFGEEFKDLKDYCRRFQLYSSANMSLNKDSNDSGVLMRIPITPIGLNTASDSNSKLLNIIREGIIPYICSAFRFYRGGLRFKVIIGNYNGTNNIGGQDTIYIQHKPDIIADTRDLSTNTINASTRTRLFQSGYAYTALSTSVNNSITVEVPCYVPTNLLMLQKPDYNQTSEIMHYSLGVLDIYQQKPQINEIVNTNVTLHYSFADDMDLSCFIGFPPMIPLAQDKDLTSFVVPEMGDDVKVEDLPHTSTGISNDLPKPEPQGPVLSVKQKFEDSIYQRGLSKIRANFNLEERENDTITAIIKDTISKFGSEYKHIIISCVGQIFHVIMNPTLQSFAVAIITFLSHIGFECTSYLGEWRKWLTSLFHTNIEKTNQPEVGDDKTEISPVDASKSSIIGSLLNMSISLVGGTIDKFRNIGMPDFTSGLFTNIRFGALTINAVITLFTNLFNIIPKMLSWVGSIVNPKKWYRWLFFNESKFIQQWVRDVEYVIDPNNRTAVHSQVRFNYHIQLLVIVGRDIVAKERSMKINNFRYLYDLNNKLNTLYSEVALTNISSGNIGVEPFCVCIYGASQVGKTYITKELTSHCLKEINYTTFDNLFYTRPTSTKHWDGVQNEPICIYDDFAHITTDEKIGELMGEFLILKSKATFTPPRAHLEDKGRKYNPLIVALTMNEPYPVFQNVLADQKAWQNRRDLLIQAEFVPPKDFPQATRVQDIPVAEAQKYKHAKFSVNKYTAARDNVSNAQEKLEVQVPKIDDEGDFIRVENKLVLITTKYMNINQLKWYVAKEFSCKYENMKYEYLRDIQQAKSFNPSSDQTFEFNLEEYIKHISEFRNNMNSQEKHTIEMAEKMAKHLKCKKCGKSSDCLCDTNYFTTSSVGNVSPQPENGEEISKTRREFMSFKNTTNNTVTDVSMEQIKNVLSKPLSMCCPPQQDMIIGEYRKQLKQNYLTSELESLLESPCAHKLAVYNPDFVTVFVDSKDKWFIVNNGEEYPVDLSEATECTCAWDNLSTEQFNKYRNTCIYLARIDDPDCKIPTYFAKDEKVVQIANRYSARVAEHRKLFFAELGLVVNDETWLGKLGSFAMKVIKPVASILVAVGLVTYIFKTDTVQNSLSAFSRKKKENEAYSELIKSHIITEDCVNNKCNMCPQMAYDAYRAPKRKIPTTMTAKRPEMLPDIRNSVDRKLRRNYFFLCAITPDGVETICRCLGLKNWIFIALDHYIDKIKSLPLNTKLEIRTNNTIKSVVLNDFNFIKVANSALVLGETPNTIPQFANIVNLWSGAWQMEHVPAEGQLYELNIPEKNNKIDSYHVQWHSNKINLHRDTLPVPNIVNSNIISTTIDYYWSYTTSGRGMCGSVLLTEMNTSSPLVGIHVAGEVSGGRGYAECICRETLENIIANFEPNPVEDVEIESQVLGDRKISLIDDTRRIKAAFEGNVNFIGVVPKAYEHKPAKKTRCKHSICYDQITKSVYDYPYLDQNDIRGTMDDNFSGSPMVNGCTYHGQPPLDFPTDLVDQAAEDVELLIKAKVMPLRRVLRPLSVEQSICGIPSIPGYDAMEFDTSEGFPFTSLRPAGAKDKRWLFDLGQDSFGYYLNSIEDVLQKNNGR